MDDTFAEVRVDDLAVGRYFEDDREGEAILVADERAQLLGEHFGEHVEPPVNQVGRGRPVRCFQIEWTSRLHVIGHVRDVNANLDKIFFRARARQRARLGHRVTSQLSLEGNCLQ